MLILLDVIKFVAQIFVFDLGRSTTIILPLVLLADADRVTIGVGIPL